MSLAIRPLSELNRQATELLVREMGIADALRFLSQFGSGSGDYTKARRLAVRHEPQHTTSRYHQVLCITAEPRLRAPLISSH